MAALGAVRSTSQVGRAGTVRSTLLLDATIVWARTLPIIQKNAISSQQKSLLRQKPRGQTPPAKLAMTIPPIQVHQATLTRLVPGAWCNPRPANIMQKPISAMC
ncbi:MAG: hypothetical protein V2I27_09735 [Erythrobacter sp.]|jgi:hypothetical protein|nr:hypothetical protein [Erythrobacter sp.]